MEKTPIRVLAIQRVNEKDKERIRAVDPSIVLTDAGGWFDGEIRATWPAFTVERYLLQDANGHGTRDERDRLLANAEVVLGGWPFPLDLRARAPAMKWFHQRPAGASNLRLGDLWGSDVTVTTSRGAGNTRAMAEYAVAGILHFAKGFAQAAQDQQTKHFDHGAYGVQQIDGKTVCVVGVGGIGRDVGLLCAGLGMRVIGTRRQPQTSLPPGFEAVAPAEALHTLLPESDYVVICCQWTEETTNLFNTQAFAAMKRGSILVNVARGEIIDETALLAALKDGQLRGAALDVYQGEFEHPPRAELWADPRVLITPHISAAGDRNRHGAIDVFCRNLRSYVDGTAMENVIDWERGY